MPNSSAPCSSEEGGGAITVEVDNVLAGSAAVNWQGDPRTLSTLGGSTVLACSGTWQITVLSAKISYILGISGLGGVTGTITIPVSQSGQSIALDDNESNGNGGSLLEVAPGGSQPSASQVAPGSAVVPCSQIISQIRPSNCIMDPRRQTTALRCMAWKPFWPTNSAMFPTWTVHRIWPTRRSPSR